MFVDRVELFVKAGDGGRGAATFRRENPTRLREAMDRRPYTSGGREFKVFYVTMASVKPPTIIFFCNDPKIVHISYQRYLENQLRQAFGFEGTPLRLFFRKRSGKEEEV